MIKSLGLEQGVVCCCCREFGIVCTSNQGGGRKVISRDGLGPISAVHQLSVPECLDRIDGDNCRATHSIWATSIIEWLQETATNSTIRATTKLTEGEERGLDSEHAVAEILSNFEILPWILSTEPQAQNSVADESGIDLIIRVKAEISQLIGSNVIQVQIKSNPKYLKLFLNKLAKKRRISLNEISSVILNECFVFLNGGAGNVTEAGVLVPFVAQLYQLIFIKSGPERAEQFVQLIPSSLKQTIISLCANGVLWRDYQFLDIDGVLAHFIKPVKLPA